MNDKVDCRSCSYYNKSPIGIIPSETCSIHIHFDMDCKCDDYTTSKWVKLKNKLGVYI